MSAPLIASVTGKYRTTCRLCGKDVAESSPLEIPLVGKPGDKADALFPILYRHLTKRHPEECKPGIALSAEIPVFFVLAAFTSEDPSLTARLEQTRASIFAVVRKNTIADATIEHLVAQFGLDAEAAAKVNEAMRELRNACCELGPYAPKGS